MTRVELARHIAADPASVALLLAEPPNDDESDRTWTLTPPRRSGVGFTAAIVATAGSGLDASGQVVVEPSSSAGSEIRLAVSTPERSDASKVERAASRFLASLALRARSRSNAA